MGLTLQGILTLERHGYDAAGLLENLVEELADRVPR